MSTLCDFSGFRGTEDDGSEIWDCWQCGGEGGFNNHEVDPLWYPPDDWEECDICQGKGYIICDPKKADRTDGTRGQQ